MTQTDFLNRYQLLYRKIDDKVQWLVIDKADGEVKKKYNFQLGLTSSLDFELFTGKKLSDELDNILISQLLADFNITE